MRFGLKIFLGALLLFVLSFDIGAYMMARQTYKQNIDMDTQRALGEHYLIASGLRDTLAAYEMRSDGIVTDDERLVSAMQSFAAYYRTLGVGLELFRDGELIFSSAVGISSERDEVNAATTSERATLLRMVDDVPYLYISGIVPAPYGRLTCVYVRNLSALQASQRQMGEWFAWIGVAVCASLALSLFFFINRITQPIRALESATTVMGKGEYSKRIELKSGDEFQELGERFNAMAESIEDHVSRITEESQRRERFSDNLAHELRTPLTSIRGFASSLQRANLSADDHLRALQHIEHEAARLQEMSDKLMEMSGLREGELRLESINVEALFTQIRNSVSGLLEETDIQMKTSIQSCCPNVVGDLVLMESLLINLVKNAVQASKPGDTVFLSASASEKRLAFEVVDHGIGMTSDQMRRAADPFYRADPSRSRNRGGAGLGLSICKQIVSLHNAVLEFSSALGKGTHVRIYNFDTTER